MKTDSYNVLRVVTWLEAGLLDRGLGGSDGVPSILQVSLSDTALALTARGSVRTQVSLRRGFGAAWTAVGFLQGGDLRV